MSITGNGGVRDSRLSRISVMPALSASSSILNLASSWSSLRRWRSTWSVTGYFHCWLFNQLQEELVINTKYNNIFKNVSSTLDHVCVSIELKKAISNLQINVVSTVKNNQSTLLITGSISSVWMHHEEFACDYYCSNNNDSVCLTRS